MKRDLSAFFLSAAFVASLSGFLFGATLFGPRCGNSFDVDELAALVSLSSSLDLTGFSSAVLRTGQVLLRKASGLVLRNSTPLRCHYFFPPFFFFFLGGRPIFEP